MLTGNLFDVAFDGQSSVTARNPDPSVPLMNFVGVDPAEGSLSIAPWVMEDPGITNPGLLLEERRAILLERAEAMAP